MVYLQSPAATLDLEDAAPAIVSPEKLTSVIPIAANVLEEHQICSYTQVLYPTAHQIFFSWKSPTHILP